MCESWESIFATLKKKKPFTSVVVFFMKTLSVSYKKFFNKVPLQARSSNGTNVWSFVSFWIENEKNSDKRPTKGNGNRPCFSSDGCCEGWEDFDMHQSSSTFNAHV